MRSPALPAAVLALTSACSPVLDWREVQPAGSGAQLLLPCKPASHSRRLMLAGSEVLLAMHTCQAGDVTWALAVAEVADPARVGPALDALRSATIANLGTAGGQTLPLAVAGATPHPSSTRVSLTGRLPDGQAVQAQVAVFSKGTRVFQATCLGAKVPADAADVFFEALRTAQ
jgi:hypothetical protein